MGVPLAVHGGGEAAYCRSGRSSGQLQKLGLKLKDLWKYHNTPASQIMNFADVLICVDAISAAEFAEEHSLSLNAIAKVKEEIDHLENSKVLKLKNKYLMKKNKLLKMIKENHQLPAEFSYDPKEMVNSDFPEAAAKLKPIIEQVKQQAVGRKEILMRTEVLLEAVKRQISVKTTERLLRDLRNLVPNEAEFLFEGKDIKVLLNEIEADMKPENAQLPLKKRASARLRDHETTKGLAAELPDLPPLPYPSGVRGGHRSRRNHTWGK